MSDDANKQDEPDSEAEAEAKRLRRERRRQRRAAEEAALKAQSGAEKDAPQENALASPPPLIAADPPALEHSAAAAPLSAPIAHDDAPPPRAQPLAASAAVPAALGPPPTALAPSSPTATPAQAQPNAQGADSRGVGKNQRRKPQKIADETAKPAPKAEAVVPETALERARREAIRARRLKGVNAAIRMLLFVITPTIGMAYYMYYWAAPYYESEAVFTIQSSETSSVPTLDTLGGQFMGIADAQDAVTIQEFILSRNTMRRIEAEKGYLNHFSRPEIDPLRRLNEAASEEAKLDFYRNRVEVYFDPNDKVVTLAVQAASSNYAQEIAETLIRYSEEKVNEISARIRDDQLSGSEADLEKRRAALGAARQALLALQQRYGEPDPTAILATIVGRKAQLEQALAMKSAEYEALRLRDAHATQAGRNLQLDMRALQREIDGVAKQIADSAPKLAEFEAALFEKTTQEQIWVSALTAFEQAQIEALRQHRYLAVVNPALAPLDPKYPQVLRLTLLTLAVAFFGFNIIALILAAVREHAKV